MLDIKLLTPQDTDEAATIFHRDGFVVIKDALTPDQLETARAGAQRVMKEQTERIAQAEANRGFARYSFGPQLHHPEWAMLIDLPSVAPILEAIWGSREYSCCSGGGDYSAPGAEIQKLHSDISRDFFQDPTGQVTLRDVPAPFIVVNFPMIDFTKENGATRFVPGTQRSRHSIPSLEEEPEWMKNSILCGPAGAALIRDVRCWHGGTANTSNLVRPMTSVGYYAPWYRSSGAALMPRERYETLSPRAQELCRYIVEDAK